MKHPWAEIILYERGELAPAERERVGAHLAGCAACRAEAQACHLLLADLRASAPPPPDIRWGPYRAELRARIERRPEGARRWWLRPVPVALSAGVAGVLLLLATQSGFHREAAMTEGMALEEVVLGRRLELLQRFPVVERLDLLEDLDVIQHLDDLSAPRSG